MKPLLDLTSKQNELRGRIESLEALEFSQGLACPSGAPTSATYVTMEAEAALTAERALTAGIGITLNDGGAGGNVTLALDDHDHTGDPGDGGQISHDNALIDVSADDHHNEDHKDRHDPEDGADPLDTAVPVDTGVANAEGNSHSLTRANHVHKLHDHAHAGVAGDGAQLDWDNIWSDAVHNHSAAGEGGEIPLTSLGSYVRGMIMRGGAGDWEAHSAETNHFLLVGDGTDIVSKAFDWDDLAAGAGADMVHNHSAAGEGGEIPLASIGGYAQGSIIRGGGADWEALALAAGAGYALISTATDIVWDQTPLWTGEHSFEAGIAFVGATTENSIIIPDAQAQALHVIDTGATEFLRINTTNNYFLIDPADTGIKVGIGTTTIPHGGIGLGKFVIEGADGANAGPHIQITTALDDYPLLQFLNWRHDNIAIYFDAYMDAGLVQRSSDPGSNFVLYKVGDKFRIRYDIGIAQGGRVVWNDGIVLRATGFVEMPFYGPGDMQFLAGGVISSVSDTSVKQDIHNTEIGLAEVLQIQGKRWRFTEESGLNDENNTIYQGFIADDIEKIIPSAVGRDSQGLRTLSYSSLMPALVEAIKELDERVTKNETLYWLS